MNQKGAILPTVIMFVALLLLLAFGNNYDLSGTDAPINDT